MRDDEFSFAPDHDDPDAVRQVQVAQRRTLDQVLLGHDVVAQHAHFLGNLHTEGFHLGIVLDAEVQLAGHRHQRRSLKQEREQGDAEHDVEYLHSALNVVEHHAHREEDGAGALHARPGNVCAGAQGQAAERNQADENAQRTAHENEEDAEQQRRPQHRRHVGRPGQQAQQEEHQQLGQPGDALEEFSDVLLEREVPHVADEDGRHIQGHQPVAADQRGKAVGEQGEREDHDRIERAALKFDPPHQPAGEVAHADADADAGGDLPGQGEDDHQHADEAGADLEAQHARARDDRHEGERQRIGHRVVAAGFQFQDGVQVLPQVQALAAQD